MTGSNKRRPNRDRKNGKEEKNDKIKWTSGTQKYRTHGEYADMPARKQRRVDVAPKENNIIRNQGEQGRETKSKEGGTRNRRKTTKRKWSEKRA